MVRQHLAEYGSVTKTSEMVGKQLDISCNTLRRWVVRQTLMTVSATGPDDLQTTTALAVGFLGAFTTYSTFAWEAVTLGRTDRLALAALYVGLSVTLGLLAGAGGRYLGRSVR